MWMHFILIVFYSPAAGMCAFGSRLKDQTFNQWHLSKCDRLLDGWKERYVLDREGLKSETHSRNPLLSLSLTEFFWKGCMGGTSGLFGDGVTFSRSWLVKWLSYCFRQTSLLACLYNVKLQSQSHCTFLPFNQLPFSVSIMQVIRCWTSAWYELKTWQCKCVFFSCLTIHHPLPPSDSSPDSPLPSLPPFPTIAPPPLSHSRSAPHHSVSLCDPCTPSSYAPYEQILIFDNSIQGWYPKYCVLFVNWHVLRTLTSDTIFSQIMFLPWC